MAADASRGARGGSGGFWDLYSRFYDAVYQLIPYRQLLWDSLVALKLAPGMRVLDAGCGTGNFEAFIAQKDLPPIELTAVDFSSGMLDLARSKCASDSRFTFEQANLDQPLPFPDDHFDRIVSINVIYAVSDSQATVSELLRVLKPDGVMVLTTPLPEFRIAPLVSEHFRRVSNIRGASRRLRTYVTSAFVLATSGVAQGFLSVFVINGRETEGRYRALTHRIIHPSEPGDGLRSVGGRR